MTSPFNQALSQGHAHGHWAIAEQAENIKLYREINHAP